MPWDEVLQKFKQGNLSSGSKSGPKVKSRRQAIAIMLAEKRKARGGNTEYQGIKPSNTTRKKMIYG
jgi:hypothetical protein